MSESSRTLVQTAEEEATTLTPSEQPFLQAFAQAVMQHDFVEAVLYDKRYGQLYVRTVMSVRASPVYLYKSSSHCSRL